MSEERLIRIEAAVDQLRVGQEELTREVRSVRDGLRTELRSSHDELRVELRASSDDLARQMRVLHEDTVDKIKALAPDLEPLRREFKAADTELHEDIDRRLTPLETGRETGTGAPEREQHRVLVGRAEAALVEQLEDLFREANRAALIRHHGARR